MIPQINDPWSASQFGQHTYKHTLIIGANVFPWIDMGLLLLTWVNRDFSMDT